MTADDSSVIDDRATRALQLHEAIELVGLDCLTYITASERDDVLARAAGIELSQRQEKALAGGLSVLGSPVVRASLTHDDRLLAAALSLTDFDDENETSVANALRLHAGGELPKIESGDPVMEAVAHLARDNYVALLVSRGDGSAVSVSLNPWNTRFQEAVIADQDLGRWFAGPAGSAEPSSFDFLSTTGGGSAGVPLSRLAGKILATPVAMCRVRQPTADEFVAAAVRGVSDLRRLAVEGRTVQARALVSFDSVTLPPETRIETKWGCLRTLALGEARLLGSFEGSGNAVLETTFPVRFHVRNTGERDPSEEESFLDAIREARGKLDARARMIALAVALALDLPMPVGIGVRGVLIEEPFGFGPALSGSIDTQPRARVELSGDEVSLLGSWLDLLASHHHRSMEVVVRRTLSAHERIDPTDGFIDALIAYDALFGTGSGDAVSLRVATGFALLLGNSENERRSIRRQVQDLYALRGDLVHGSIPELPWHEATERRQEAVALLVRALRALYEGVGEEAAADLLRSQDRIGELLMRVGLESRARDQAAS